MTSDETPYDNFPPRELIDHLADKYFENMNNYLPLLHRPTFNRGLNDGLHFRDRPFGAIVFLVCANGSRWSSDSRIPDDGRFPGWTWFQKVEHTRWMVLERPKLEDLQTCAVCGAFLRYSTKLLTSRSSSWRHIWRARVFPKAVGRSSASESAWRRI